jgi:hypothetical protein
MSDYDFIHGNRNFGNPIVNVDNLPANSNNWHNQVNDNDNFYGSTTHSVRFSMTIMILIDSELL